MKLFYFLRGCVTLLVALTLVIPYVLWCISKSVTCGIIEIGQVSILKALREARLDIER
jgi:hypothetical protein